MERKHFRLRVSVWKWRKIFEEEPFSVAFIFSNGNLSCVCFSWTFSNFFGLKTTSALDTQNTFVQRSDSRMSKDPTLSSGLKRRNRCFEKTDLMGERGESNQDSAVEANYCAFPAITKLASFQVTFSNVNPDTAPDVKWRVTDLKKSVSLGALHISTFSGTLTICRKEN